MNPYKYVMILSSWFRTVQNKQYKKVLGTTDISERLSCEGK